MELCKSIESARFDEKDSSRLTARELSGLGIRLFYYVKPFWHSFLFGCLCALLHAGASAVQPYFLKLLIDDVLVKNDLARLKVILLLIMLSAVVKGILMYAQGFFIAFAGQSAVKTIRNDVYGHIQTLPLTFFEKWKTGQIMYRVITDIHQMTETLTSSIPVAIADIFVFFFSVGVMIYMDWRMTIVAFVASPGIAYIMHYFGSLIQHHIASLQKEVSNLNAVMQENINGIKVVKAFSAEEREKKKFEAINELSFHSVMKSIQFKLMQTPLVEMLGTVGIIIIIGLGSYLVSIREFTTGDLIAFCAFMLVATSPVNRFSTTYSDLRKGMVSASRVFELMDFPVEAPDSQSAVEKSYAGEKIQFNNASFSYDGSHKVLKEITFTVSMGEAVAIVGTNGSGKSTLVNLIPRFYRLSGGSIEIDGINTEHIKVRSLRRIAGLVQQETILFSGTVRENVLFGEPEASQDAMIEACRQAGAHDFIEELEGGYDYRVGERGVNLSGGQRQKIALARTLLRHPGILILDEATSSLDLKAEASIYDAVMKRRKERITLIIAHRLSTVTWVDRILVLSDGSIVESGSHEELMSRGGVYKNLYDAQKEMDEQGVEDLNPVR